MFFKRLEMWCWERRWRKRGRRKAFTWVYRYLRLHKELLDDPVYQEIFDYHRATLVTYMRKDVKRKKLTDEQLGEAIDLSADHFNNTFAKRVNAYKPFVDEIYEIRKMYSASSDDEIKI